MLIAPEAPNTQTFRVPVVKVLDGDGFLTKVPHGSGDAVGDSDALELSVRFGFIDAPELAQQGGPEAQAFLSGLIGGRSIELVILKKMDTGKTVDRYHRLVCVPYLTTELTSHELKASGIGLSEQSIFQGRMALTRNIELEMVLNGWAWVLERYGPDERYLRAFKEAQRHRRGIWAWDNNISPWEFKKHKYRRKRAALSSIECAASGCDGHLVRREGRFGAFLGCSNYPKCRCTRPLS